MLRPRLHKVKVDDQTTRYIFALERPNGTRRLFTAATVSDRRYSGWRVRGVELEAKVFG